MPSGFDVVRSEHCDFDLELIFDHLFAAYRKLGDPVVDAFDRAERRLRGIEDEIERLGDVPYQRTLDPKIMDGLRHVTKSGAVFYFIIDDAERRLRVLGVFFGGQDHRAHILTRIAGPYRSGAGDPDRPCGGVIVRLRTDPCDLGSDIAGDPVVEQPSHMSSSVSSARYIWAVTDRVSHMELVVGFLRMS